MLVLDRLWQGDLSPCEKVIRRGGKYDRLIASLCQTEDELRAELNPKGEELLKKYIDTQLELQTVESRETFFEGFRMAAGLFLDVVSEYKGEFQYPSED